MLQDDESTRRRFSKKLERQQVPQRSDAQRKVGLFNHLHQYERDISLTKNMKWDIFDDIYLAMLDLSVPDHQQMQL